MSQLEPYLPDSQVGGVATRILDAEPVLQRYNAQFATARIEPPWHGLLPDGRVGWTRHPVIQFVIASDHPRSKFYKLLGSGKDSRHVTTATAWQQAFEQSVKDEKHLVSGGQMSSLEKVFRGLAAKHVKELNKLSNIIN
jgi:hypothetical protein